jgi:hypothetical protein
MFYVNEPSFTRCWRSSRTETRRRKPKLEWVALKATDKEFSGQERARKPWAEELLSGVALRNHTIELKHSLIPVHLLKVAYSSLGRVAQPNCRVLMTLHEETGNVTVAG